MLITAGEGYEKCSPQAVSARVLPQSRGMHPMEGQEGARVNQILPLPTSDESRCSQPVFEVVKVFLPEEFTS